MALTQRLQLRQSQALVMTPQLMQAIKLLQLSNLDLVAYVEAELERNPLLDRSAEDERRPARGRRRGIGRTGPNADGEGWSGGTRAPPSARRRSRSTPASRTVFPDHAEASPPRGAAESPAGYSEWAGVGAGGRDDGDYNLEAFVPAETTLADRLRDQLTLAIANPPRRMIGQYLIDLVDEAGYLSGDLDAIGGKARHQRRRDRSGARHICRASIRRASARATSPNA